MAIVAVAGGTGGVGRTIVEAITAAGKHTVKILGRKANPELEEKLGVPIIVVDYADVESVTKALEENHIDTVISCINMLPMGGEYPKEVELIQAADASKCTRRIISSDWGSALLPKHAKLLSSVKTKEDARDAMEKAKSLETTFVLCGLFMDYWGTPGVKSNMAPMVLNVDIPNEHAVISGDGNTPIAMTHSVDVARFVAAALDLDKWDSPLTIIGDKVTLNDILTAAEEAKGTKFTVVHDSLEKLRGGSMTELPGQIAAYGYFPKEYYYPIAAMFSLWFEEGALDMERVNLLNDKFSDIKPITVKDMIYQGWKKV